MEGYWNLVDKSEITTEFEKILNRALSYLNSKPNNKQKMNEYMQSINSDSIPQKAEKINPDKEIKFPEKDLITKPKDS